MGCSLYAHDLQNNIYVLDCATGNVDLRFNLTAALQAIGVGTLLDIACHATTMYGIAGGNLVRINLRDASVVNIGVIGPFVNGLAVSSTGIIYASGGNAVYTLDPSTGAASFAVGLGGFSSSGDLAFDCFDNLYGTAIDTAAGDTLIRIDLNAAVATAVGPIGFSSVWGISFYCCALYGVAVDGSVMTINTANGFGTRIGNGGANFGGLATCCSNCGCGC